MACSFASLSFPSSVLSQTNGKRNQRKTTSFGVCANLSKISQSPGEFPINADHNATMTKENFTQLYHSPQQNFTRPRRIPHQCRSQRHNSLAKFYWNRIAQQKFNTFEDCKASGQIIFPVFSVPEKFS